MALEQEPVAAPVRARVAHNYHGRVRVRFDKAADVEPSAERLRNTLASVAGIRGVEARLGARCVLLHYDPAEVRSEEILLGAVAAAGVELEAGRETKGSPDRSAQDTTVGRSVSSAVGKFNRGIGTVSKGAFDLRDMFPLTLLGLGLRKVAQGQIQPIPWYNLLYYCYSTFTALHARRGAAPQPDAVEILRRRYALGELSQRDFRRMMNELDRDAGTKQEDK
jgi:hypothetical protein